MNAPKVRSRRRAKRVQVLDEAAKALNRRGVSRTSLGEIAERIGVSRAALYYYFEDQQDLVFQCYVRSCEQLVRHFREACQGGSDTLDVIGSFVTNVLSDDEPEFAALSEPAYLRPEQRSTILGLYEALRANLVDTLEYGIRRKELRVCSSQLVASAVIGLISWVPTTRRWRRLNPLSDSEIVEAIRSTLREGIAADRSSPVTYNSFALEPVTLTAAQIFDQEALATARQQAILVAASWCFNLKGEEATSLDEIAQRVGVTKKVIYHNVGDKQALLAECYRRAFRFYEDVGARMRAYDGTRVDALSASAHALAEASLREDIAPFRPFTGLEARPAAERREMQSAGQRLADTYLDAYKQGRAENSLREFNAPAVFAILPGMVEWLPKWFEALDEVHRAQAPRELAELFRLGLRPLQTP